ncbi:2'-5' RNA ligase family protein [Streptomyces sp. A30]|uniref:2'-5' RNA ligase family protein n=1 Tax=Streptomyces sp. A30 TaxID=2789273 RepID=UPI00397EFC24
MYLKGEPERNPGLASLVQGGRQALKDFPLTHVEDPWLHITIDQITDRPAAAIPQDERDTLADALSTALADFEPFEITIGSMLSYSSGVIADCHPDDQLAALHHRVRETIRITRGDDAVRYPWGVQHLTISYANGEASSDDAQRLLRRVRPSHASLNVDSVHLVDVTADKEAKTITWEELAKIPLGTAL